MNEPPGARARVGLTGLTVAEHFRDAEGQDVLLFIDNIFRFTQVSFTLLILYIYDLLFTLNLFLLSLVLMFTFTSLLQANSEVSALLGRIPSAVGYQPTLATDLGGLQERITTTKKGSITSVQAIYVPADDLTDPAPATTFAHLDATTVLSRQAYSFPLPLLSQWSILVNNKYNTWAEGQVGTFSSNKISYTLPK